VIKIEGKVLVGSSKVEGVVVEIGGDSVLVEHMIVADGRDKKIKQWYGVGIVEEVIEKVEVEKIITEISAATKESGKRIGKSLKKTNEVIDKKIELGIIPEKSDSDGE
jgi:heterodisulfide reductase subunit A-like polyferredoxin